MEILAASSSKYQSHPTITRLFHPAYHQNKQEKAMPELKLQIDGMHCGSCVRRVTEALKSVGGAVVNEVRVGAARLTFNRDPVPVDLVIAALAKAGFTARLEA
jgi:copper chaperone CopZ